MNDTEGDHGKHELDGEASRPIHQFISQTTAEREQLRGKFMALGVEPQTLSIDINTMAHINIRNVWLKQKIWDEAWVDILPGLRWEHERRRHPSVSEISSELLVVQASILQKYSREVNLAKVDSGKVNYSEAAILESGKTPHTGSVPGRSTSTARPTPYAGGAVLSPSPWRGTTRHTIEFFGDGSSRHTAEKF
jgi:hypothetical protein